MGEGKTLGSFKTPQVGLEPTTYRLTADRSTAELLRNQKRMLTPETGVRESPDLYLIL